MKTKFQFGNFSKYYYLVHPMVIFLISILFKKISNYPYLNILTVLIITHISSILIIRIKTKNKKLII